MISDNTTVTIGVLIILIGAAFSCGIVWQTVRDLKRDMKEVKEDLREIKKTVMKTA